MRALLICAMDKCGRFHDEAKIRAGQIGVIKTGLWYCDRCSESHQIESDGSTLSYPTDHLKKTPQRAHTEL